MVISRRVLRRNRLRPRLLGFDSREDLSHPCTTVYALALLVTVEQQRSQPPLSIALPRGPVLFRSRSLPFWSPTTSDPAYGAPLLERRVARIMVGTGDLLSSMRMTLSAPCVPLLDYRIRRLPAKGRRPACPVSTGGQDPNSRCSHEIALNPAMACFRCLMGVLIGAPS
jgi:hypothetical protein